MKNFASFLYLMPLFVCHLDAAEAFDGKSLAGWRVQDAPYWSVKDGILIGESDEKKENSFLWTERDYVNFEFESDFRYSGVIDSGVFLRHIGDQIQIGVSGSLKRDMTGSPYIGKKGGYPQEAIGVAALLKEHEWNHLKIQVSGPEYIVWLNGQKILEYKSESAPEKGPIGLHIHPKMLMKIEFRKIEIKEI